MNKKVREQVLQKYNNHCAYCGNEITLKNMQVDHIRPKRICVNKNMADDIENLNPSCRRCNHYKRASLLEDFRKLLLTLHDRVHKIYINKVAEDYGVIVVNVWDGKFYFEREGTDD